jgi:hypothetical protein
LLDLENVEQLVVVKGIAEKEVKTAKEDQMVQMVVVKLEEQEMALTFLRFPWRILS